MAKDTYIQIKRKELPKVHFQADINDIGIAAGCLKPCGLKVYLYLVKNADLFTQGMYPNTFSEWLGETKVTRNTRRTIDDGIVDLAENGYLRQADDSGRYEFSETPVAEWIQLAKMKKEEEKVPFDIKDMF